MVHLEKKSQSVFSVFADRRAVIMLFLGFSAGIPILLIFSSLSLWLGEAGVERKAVTFFSWAALGYSFKFVWAPLVDEIPLPWFSRVLGRRRSWLLLAQLLIITAIGMMALTDPAQGGTALTQMALAAVLLGFAAATQDIVIDAYRIELAPVAALQAALSATYNAGYRLGMIVAGAGALYLASLLGSEKGHYLYSAWQTTYAMMAAAMLVGVITTLVIREPSVARRSQAWSAGDYARLVGVFVLMVLGFVSGFVQLGRMLPETESALLGFLQETLRVGTGGLMAAALAVLATRLGLVNRDMVVHTWVAPVRDFFDRYGASTALWLLALIGFYRVSDIVAGVISNVFYQDMGFSKAEIATAVKTFGVLVSIAGGFLGGLLAQRYAVLRVLMLGAVLSSATNLVFVQLAHVGHDLVWMYVAITADNLASGLAGAAFVAFLSSLTNVSFTAVQYAIFSSLMTLLPKVLGGYSGTMVDALGYPEFFALTAAMGIPVLYLILRVQRQLAALPAQGPDHPPGPD